MTSKVNSKPYLYRHIFAEKSVLMRRIVTRSSERRVYAIAV
jgi:hypothetical protein